MTKILGKAEATAEQMAAYLLSQNQNPQINMPAVDFCQLFLDVAAKEGTRGDGLFAQSCWETNDFRYTGTVSADQNNYAGLGTVNAETKGAYFATEAEGILAQAQHAKAYATTGPLNEACVDPRYHLLVKYGKCGTAQHWEDLGGKWAVPGYSTKLYASLKDANDAKDSYGYKIVGILNEILAMPKEGDVRNMVINVHAGHNPDGKAACGAIGYIKESTEARRVKDEVIRMLRELGHTVYDCTVDNGTSASDVLKKIVSKCNAHKVDLDISIHFNAAGNLPEDGKTTGTEVMVYSGYSKARDEAEAVCKEIASLGFKNRGVKFRPDLYFLKKTVAPAMLIECCFVNDKDDTNLYDYYKMAKAIVKGITGVEYEAEEENEEVVETPNRDDEKLYHVALKKADAEKIKETLRELGIDALIVEE